MRHPRESHSLKRLHPNPKGNINRKEWATMKYDYRAAIESDVKRWIRDNEDMITEFMDDHENDIDQLLEWLDEQLWVEDSVTGNGSGMYATTWMFEEYLCHNLDLYTEACREFGQQPSVQDACAMDVTIRCYLLSEVIYDVVPRIVGR